MNTVCVLQYRGGKRMSHGAQRAQSSLEEEEQLMSRQERHLALAEKSCARRCGRALWPLLVIIGCLLFVVDVIVLLTLVLTK